MVRVEVIGEFTLEKFNEIANIQRKNKDTYGRLYVGDKFECTKEMAEYLTGNNALGKVVVKILEVIPAKEPEIKPDVEIKPIEKPKKKKSKKK